MSEISLRVFEDEKKRNPMITDRGETELGENFSKKSCNAINRLYFYVRKIN
jgi:hypothetical protein